MAREDWAFAYETYDPCDDPRVPQEVKDRVEENRILQHHRQLREGN